MLNHFDFVKRNDLAWRRDDARDGLRRGFQPLDRQRNQHRHAPPGHVEDVHELAEDDDIGVDERDPILRMERGEEHELPIEVQQAMLEAWRQGCKAYGLVMLEVERKVVHDGWRQAGTLDRLALLTQDITERKDAEARIIGVEPRYHNANEATTSALGYTARSAHKENLVAEECLGAFQVELIGKPDVKFNIGVLKGVTLGDKEKMWQRREELIGHIITFKHQGYGGGYDAPRTPVFYSFRDPIEL